MKSTKRTYQRMWLTALLIPFLFAGCAAGAEIEPTLSGEMVFTSVAQTLAVQLTGTAEALPSTTPTRSPSPSRTAASTATLPAAGKTLAPNLPAAGGAVSSGAAAVTLCDSAGFVADVTIPDGTSISPGATFTKTWRLSNAGTCTWSSSYTLIFYSGSQMSGDSSQAFPVDVVYPGGTMDISVELTAPTTAGTYTGYWALANASGTRFGIGSGGNPFYVQIVVGSSATETTTPTPTSTDDSSSATSTPTSTTQATTAVPTTAVPTSVPTTAVPTTAPTAVPTTAPTSAATAASS